MQHNGKEYAVFQVNELSVSAPWNERKVVVSSAETILLAVALDDEPIAYSEEGHPIFDINGVRGMLGRISGAVFVEQNDDNF